MLTQDTQKHQHEPKRPSGAKAGPEEEKAFKDQISKAVVRYLNKYYKAGKFTNKVRHSSSTWAVAYRLWLG